MNINILYGISDISFIHIPMQYSEIHCRGPLLIVKILHQYFSLLPSLSPIWLNDQSLNLVTSNQFTANKITK